MPVYKVLYLDDRREKAFSGLVRADDNERWDSPIEALNELAAGGWELVLPIYGPIPGRDRSGQFIEALLLFNKNGTRAQDVQRRVERTRGQILAAEKRRATCRGTMEERVLNQHIRELSAELAELEARLRETNGSSA